MDVSQGSGEAGKEPSCFPDHRDNKGPAAMSPASQSQKYLRFHVRGILTPQMFTQNIPRRIARRQLLIGSKKARKITSANRGTEKARVTGQRSSPIS